MRSELPPRRGDREQDHAGEGEADARAEQRRAVLQADLDRHPGARPDDDEHAVEGEQGGAGHVPSVADMLLASAFGPAPIVAEGVPA